MELVEAKDNSYGLSVHQADGLLHIYGKGGMVLLATAYHTGRILETFVEDDASVRELEEIAQRASTELEKRKEESRRAASVPPSIAELVNAVRGVIALHVGRGNAEVDDFARSLDASLSLHEAAERSKSWVRPPARSVFVSGPLTSRYVLAALDANGNLDFKSKQPPFTDATEQQICAYYWKHSGDRRSSAPQEAIAQWFNDQGWYFRVKTW